MGGEMGTAAWVTAWFYGMLAIAALIMCAGLLPMLRTEAHASKVPLTQNRPLRLMVALAMHAAAAVPLFAAAFFGPLLHVETPLWFTWSAFGLWLVAKTMIITVTGWARTCGALYAVWTAFCAGAGLNGAWGWLS